MKNKAVGFIGTGNMGAALAKAVVKAEYPVCLYDKDASKAKALADEIGGKTATLAELFDTCDYIFVGVKPNILPILAEDGSTETPHDYIVKKVARSLNSVTIAISKVVVSG